MGYLQKSSNAGGFFGFTMSSILPSALPFQPRVSTRDYLNFFDTYDYSNYKDNYQTKRGYRSNTSNPDTREVEGILEVEDETMLEELKEESLGRNKTQIKSKLETIDATGTKRQVSFEIL
ncbi:LOW QUALITY PROTEIN: hypothetical protein PanWU01x14_188080 [Parasponia andersonii]|uniref:Uncharacterized protein n=1 Tax=Parasponia andersonii TaxID=3476 RepID=A0A2P5C340_PARAD|nr:LOW QUALITY PROTEIN: hypothetical protein PanWU01x14_188080 [Parasponia andersonii]